MGFSGGQVGDEVRMAFSGREVGDEVRTAISGGEVGDEVRTAFSGGEDQVSGNWWFVYTEKNIHGGYWPKSIFTDLAKGASQVSWGGRTSGRPEAPSAQMGSGYFPDDSSKSKPLVVLNDADTAKPLFMGEEIKLYHASLEINLFISAIDIADLISQPRSCGTQNRKQEGLCSLNFRIFCIQKKKIRGLNFDGTTLSTGNLKEMEEVHEELESGMAPNCHKAKGRSPLSISTSRKGLLSPENPRKGFMDILTTLPSRVGFLKFGSAGSLASPSAKFQRIAEERDEISRSVPSSSGHGIQEDFNGVFNRKIDWVSLRKICKRWIQNPMNMALLVWITCVTVSGAILFLVMTGMLNNVLPRKSQRDEWFEINNQILNALFTLMCLYQHPKRFHHLVLLCRWRPEDISKLRKIYCKNGTYKPHEWAHMMVVVVLLHVNCFAQYALCGLNLGYKRSERPAIGVGISISIAFSAPAIAGLYTIVSPLGKEYDSKMDEEANRPNQLSLKSLEKRFSFVFRDEERLIENRPEWKGGLFNIWDDITVAYLSLFCSFGVFGWNMERLGFGNMYVHIATFLLFCMAPFWIFNLAAINIDNETIREALGVTGIVLCVFGLLYGGFWRIQMRKRFNLPGNSFCFGEPAVTDCAQWLFCCWCSLAQEIRTGDFYDIVEDKLCRKQMDESYLAALSPLPREDATAQFRSGSSSPIWNSSSLSKFRAGNDPSPTRVSKGYYSSDRRLITVEEESSIRGKENNMTPPVPSLIQRDDNQL
ncbi:hypothetical protein HHK36_020218 [Tetracentron sinense]|uniref:Neprosin PEP catalytic domain-containing protein n=1 Tax=Tetracentron sinense TaxID=13715 RepID=A0A834YWR2_TETSI|nr:hypothetical protein HHK36_020218 [Tetracentron sinense]